MRRLMAVAGLAMAGAAVVVASLIPGVSRYTYGPWDSPLISHFLVYAAVALMATLVWRSSLASALRIGAALAMCGALLELIQLWLPYRTASLLSAAVNLLGAISGAVMGWALGRVLPGVRRPNALALSSKQVSPAAVDVSARVALISLWRGSTARTALPVGVAAEDLARVASREGVSMLAWNRCTALHLQRAGETTAWGAALGDAARRSGARGMLLHSQLSQVCAALRAHGSRFLLLKGLALAYWLYRNPLERECSDIDLLFANRAEADSAAQVLETLGLRTVADSGRWVAFQFSCVPSGSTSFAAPVDMHWSLANSPLFANRFDFNDLWRRGQTIASGLEGVRVLSPADAYLHAAMHRTLELSAGGDRLKWLYDFALMAERFDGSDWDGLIAEASRSGLAGSCRAAAEAAGEVFGCLPPDEVLVALRRLESFESLNVHRMSAWYYRQSMELRALPGLRLRAAWVLQRVLGPDELPADRVAHSTLGTLTLRLRRGMSRLFGQR